MKILYAGDSWEGGPANYLLGILKWTRADFLHVPAAIKMDEQILKQPFDAIILSDYSKSLMDLACEKLLVEKTLKGCGLIMIGGWASFSGPYGGWRNSLVEGLLPVTCQEKDDRVAMPGGAFIQIKNSHPLFEALSFENSPVLCGLNEVIPKQTGQIILTAQTIQQKTAEDRTTALSLNEKEYPLFVIDESQGRRCAVLATDIAPHWCGGLVDWGNQTEKITISPKAEIEIGNYYIRFMSAILRWLTKSDSPVSQFR